LVFGTPEANEEARRIRKREQEAAMMQEEEEELILVAGKRPTGEIFPPHYRGYFVWQTPNSLKKTRT